MDNIANLLADLQQRGYTNDGGVISKEIPNVMPDPNRPMAGWTDQQQIQRNIALANLAGAAADGTLQAPSMVPRETDSEQRARYAQEIAAQQLAKSKIPTSIQPAGYYEGTAIPKYGSANLNFYSGGPKTEQDVANYTKPWDTPGALSNETGLRSNLGMLEDVMGKDNALKTIGSAHAEEVKSADEAKKLEAEKAMGEAKGQYEIKKEETKGFFDYLKAMAAAKGKKEILPPGGQKVLDKWISDQWADYLVLKEASRFANGPASQDGNLWSNQLDDKTKFEKMSKPTKERLKSMMMDKSFSEAATDRPGIHKDTIDRRMQEIFTKLQDPLTSSGLRQATIPEQTQAQPGQVPGQPQAAPQQTQAAPSNPLEFLQKTSETKELPDGSIDVVSGGKHHTIPAGPQAQGFKNMYTKFLANGRKMPAPVGAATQ
jgi:hypothetical protein